jgi:hypothetical protein
MNALLKAYVRARPSPVADLPTAGLAPVIWAPPVGSSIPNLAPLPLHGDAGGIANLDPDRTSTVNGKIKAPPSPPTPFHVSSRRLHPQG